MTKYPNTFYKYRAFDTTTLDTLCRDTVYFAHPGSFNDPLDCNPTLECDSSNEDLRKLLAFLIQKRAEETVLTSLQQAGVKGEKATEYAKKQGQSKAEYMLADLAYEVSNPEYDGKFEEVESCLLVQEIESELHRHYERGVCCFSTTYSSPFLWSHYGDQHQGLCIGYGVERNPVPQLNKVVYGGSRAIKTSTLIGSFLMENMQDQADLDRDVLLRKARGWSYEREWRLIGKQGIQDSPLLLKEVTFGLRCACSVKHAVVKALAGRENEVHFFEMYKVSGSYDLRRRDLDIDELGVYWPRTAKSMVEHFGPCMD